MYSRRTELSLDEESSTLKFEWGSDDAEALRDFKLGIRCLRDKAHFRALAYFRRAHDLERHNPYFLSYLGLATALADRNWAEGVRLCDSAIRMKRNQAQLYLNLAEVCLMAGKKGDAVETLEVGIQYASTDLRLQRMLGSLGVRQPAVLAFLDRSHPLNRTLGRIRYRLHRLLGPH
jgi:Flp pilus assembly protein TadD